METLKNDIEIQNIMEQAYLSTRSMCKLYFNDTFSAPFSSLHDKIFELIDSGKHKIAIAAPRGIGKTSIARAVVSKGILYRDVNFVVYVSNSATLAEMQTENIKRELLSNQIIRKLFGSIKTSDVEGIDDTFSKLAWVAFGNTFILPRGSGQQIRGLNWSNHRPQLLVIDDLEDKEEIRNEDLRKKQKEWFFSDVLKTEDKYGEPSTFIYIDTIKHEDSLLETLMESDEWTSLRLSICDANYNTADSNYMTTEEIKAEVEEHRKKGLMDLFYMERMNIPISIEDAVFKEEYFKYFEDQGSQLIVKTMSADGVLVDETIPTARLLHVTVVDPAKTTQLHSAESAIVTLAVDRESHKIFVRDIENKKVRPDELYDIMFGQVLRFNSRILGVEVTSLHQFISQPIENEMRIRSIFPMYLELKAVGKKEERIATLAPLYKLGYIYHNKNNCGPLEAQLRWFPRAKYADVMDATAYITKIMDELDYYFDPQDMDKGDPEDEFKELTYEKPVENWRRI